HDERRPDLHLVAQLVGGPAPGEREEDRSGCRPGSTPRTAETVGEDGEDHAGVGAGDHTGALDGRVLSAAGRAVAGGGEGGVKAYFAHRFSRMLRAVEENPCGGFVMKWVTRERVKVDRVACPWLIRKFIDPKPEFLFVPAEKVMEAAGREDAIPFDVPGV